MDTSNMSPSAGGAIPARLGLPRRSSFDPLSTSNKSGLSLGSLPGPSFGVLPSGLRSVPALDSSRPFGNGALRNVSAPLGDGQRTPGGSLVVGAEVFGFGKHAPRDSSERRRGAGAAAAAAAAGPAAVAAAKDSLTTSGSVDGLDDVLSATGSARLATGGGAWRGTDFVRQSASSTDDLRLRSTADDARFRKGLDRLSAVRSNPFPRCMLAADRRSARGPPGARPSRSCTSRAGFRDSSLRDRVLSASLCRDRR